MNFFKPKDFSYPGPWGSLCDISPESAAGIANSILTERGVRVYGQKVNNTFIQDPSLKTTHTALLVCIEELPKAKCEHDEPIVELEAFMSSTTLTPGKVGFSFFNADKWTCSKCGIKLRAKWEPV